MPAAKTFTVEGGGEFPLDMLRRDECEFASEGDKERAHNTHRRRQIWLQCTGDRQMFAPTTRRWESFGWKVVAGSGLTEISPPLPTKERWPELTQIAEDLASEVCRKINERASQVQTVETCRYKAQGILEPLILELQKRV